jgi:hypothetical protein
MRPGRKNPIARQTMTAIERECDVLHASSSEQHTAGTRSPFDMSARRRQP